MRRLITTSALALVALASIVSSASAATAKPSITSVTPSQVAIGQKLVINGKNFKKGVTNNRIFFTRASDGKTVRARPTTANSTRQMSVIVPKSVSDFLTVVNGQPTPTRFQIQVLSGRFFTKRTALSKSPIISPAGTTPSAPGGTTPGTTTPGTTTPGTTPTPPACPSTTPGADSDGDGLPDSLELQIHTDPCNPDTDHDGISDGYEYYSALDLNGNNLPYPGSRPYPNPLDGSDANKDFDGDGMTMAEEYAAWVYGGKVLPTGPGQSFPYSDGNQTSPAGNGPGAMDLDHNGVITDEEKDADSDGLPNWIELAKGEGPRPAASGCNFFTSSNGSGYGTYANIFTDCGGPFPMPNGNTFTGLKSGVTVTGAPAPLFSQTNHLNYLNPDTDGDGVPDGLDDQDFDGVNNTEEIQAGGDGLYSSPMDPCDPNPNSRSCPHHTAP